MSVTLKTKGEERFQGNRHGFQDRSDESDGKTGGNLRLTIGGRCGDTSGKVVGFHITQKNFVNAQPLSLYPQRIITLFEEKLAVTRLELENASAWIIVEK